MIAKGESSTLECKLTTGELHRGMESACAFMNSDGGWLLFGISPQMRIVGQSVSDATRREIAAELRKIEPPVEVETEYIELPGKPGKFVVALHCNSANFRNGPYSYDGRAFYRVESTTSVMPRTLYEERMRLSSTSRFSWENAPNPNILLEDIDVELLFQTLHDGINIRRIPASTMTLRNPLPIMQKLGVANKDGSLNNAANVLFSKYPTAVHPQCAVRLARFAGTDKRFFRDQTICEGNLFAQYDAVLDFCLKHLNLSGRMDRRYREDTLTVPYEALREATANMLCHRSWYADNMTPSLAIYDDRMVFQNPGAFPPGTKWQDFVDNSLGSLPANPTIADVFYRRGTMEKWGRGIGLIFSCCLDAGLPSPFVQIVPPFINLTIPFVLPLSTHDASVLSGVQSSAGGSRGASSRSARAFSAHDASVLPGGQSSAEGSRGAGSRFAGSFSTHDTSVLSGGQIEHRSDEGGGYGREFPSSEPLYSQGEEDGGDDQSCFLSDTEEVYGVVSPSVRSFSTHDSSRLSDGQSSAGGSRGASSRSAGSFSTHDASGVSGGQSNARGSHGAGSRSAGVLSTHDESGGVHGKILSRDERIKAKILQYCAQPRSLREIAGMLGLTNVRWVRRRYVVPLLKEGLRHSIPQRPTSHYQKYVASIPSRRKNK